jgi:hypothetical protein
MNKNTPLFSQDYDYKEKSKVVPAKKNNVKFNDPNKHVPFSIPFKSDSLHKIEIDNQQIDIQNGKYSGRLMFSPKPNKPN